MKNYNKVYLLKKGYLVVVSLNKLDNMKINNIFNLKLHNQIIILLKIIKVKQHRDFKVVINQ